MAREHDSESTQFSLLKPALRGPGTAGDHPQALRKTSPAPPGQRHQRTAPAFAGERRKTRQRGGAAAQPGINSTATDRSSPSPTQGVSASTAEGASSSPPGSRRQGAQHQWAPSTSTRPDDTQTHRCRRGSGTSQGRRRKQPTAEGRARRPRGVPRTRDHRAPRPSEGEVGPGPSSSPNQHSAVLLKGSSSPDTRAPDPGQGTLRDKERALHQTTGLPEAPPAQCGGPSREARPRSRTSPSSHRRTACLLYTSDAADE